MKTKIIFLLCFSCGKLFCQGLQLNSGARFKLNSGTFFTLSGNTSDIINSASSYIVNDGNIYLQDDFSNSGTYTSSSGKMIFNGSTLQDISGSSSPSFFNIDVTNSSTGLRLLQPVSVSNILNLASGDINLNGFNITLSGSAAQVTGETNSKRIKGTSGEITATRTLSASTSYTNIAGIGLNITTGTTAPGVTSIERGHAAQTGAGNTSIERYYDIAPATNSGLNASLSFYYFDNELNGQTSDANMILWRSTDAGLTWSNQGGTWSDNGTNDFVTLSGINAFSRWTVSNQSSNPLPIELLSFTATLNTEGYVDINWVTAYEINNNYFTVERSADAINFDSLFVVDGAGTSSIQNFYKGIDSDPLSGKSYYRLKQTDFSGLFSYSNTVTVNLTGIDLINIYPNPSSSSTGYIIGAEASTSINILIVDMFGRKLLEKTQDIPAGVTNGTIDVSRFSSGTYMLKVETTNGLSVSQKQFLVR